MCESSYKAVILAVKLAGAGEEHSASGHVDAHGEGLCGKQGLGGGRGGGGRKRKKRPYDFMT